MELKVALNTYRNHEENVRYMKSIFLTGLENLLM